MDFSDSDFTRNFNAFIEKQMKVAFTAELVAAELSLWELEEECKNIRSYLSSMSVPKKFPFAKNIKQRMDKIYYKSSCNFQKWFEWRKKFYQYEDKAI